MPRTSKVPSEIFNFTAVDFQDKWAVILRSLFLASSLSRLDSLLVRRLTSVAVESEFN